MLLSTVVKTSYGTGNTFAESTLEEVLSRDLSKRVEDNHENNQEDRSP